MENGNLNSFNVGEGISHGQFSEKNKIEADGDYSKQQSIVADLKTIRKRVIDKLDSIYGY